MRTTKTTLLLKKIQYQPTRQDREEAEIKKIHKDDDEPNPTLINNSTEVVVAVSFIKYKDNFKGE